MTFQNDLSKYENKHIFSHIPTDTFCVGFLSECFAVSKSEYSNAK